MPRDDISQQQIRVLVTGAGGPAAVSVIKSLELDPTVHLHLSRFIPTDVDYPLKEKLAAIEEQLIQVKAKTRQDTLNHPAKLNVKLSALTGVVASADAAPTEQAYQVFDFLSECIESELKRLQECIDTDLAAFNRLIREADLPSVMRPTPSKSGRDE